jgi:hypothetical protein
MNGQSSYLASAMASFGLAWVGWLILSQEKMKA